VVLPR